MKEKLHVFFSMVALALFAVTARAQVTIDVDLTAQFPVAYTAWSGASGMCASTYGPTVTTNDGRSTLLCEKYESSLSGAGTVMKSTLTGLTNGTYKIELYGSAAFTSGRGFESDLVEGDETAVYLYAQSGDNTVKKYIPAHIATKFETVATVVLDNVVVTDGTITIGINKDKALTNWHIVQIKGVTAVVDAAELLAASVAKAQSFDSGTLPASIVSGLQSAVIDNNKAYTTAEEYKAAIAAIDGVVATAEKYQPLGRCIKAGKDVRAVVSDADALATYDAAVKDVVDAFEAVNVTDFDAAIATMTKAVANLQKGQTSPNSDMSGVLAVTPWTCPQGNGPGTYASDCTETYGENAFQAGKVIYQKIDGLAAGTYEVKFLAVANMAWKSFATGSGIAQIYANTATQDIEVIAQTACTPADYERTLTATVGQDGVLEYGIQNVAEGGNWYVVKALGLTLVKSAPSNLNFSQGTPVGGADAGIVTYAKDAASNGTTLSQAQPVARWSFVGDNGDGRASGLFAYGSEKFLGSVGYNVPALNPEGKAEGNAFGIVSVWTASTQYTQPVTLPAGKYVITLPVINVVGAEEAPEKSWMGFIADDNTEYLAQAKAYPAGKWTYETVSFDLDEETSGKFSMGLKAFDKGSNAAPHLFVDCFDIRTFETDDARNAYLATLPALEQKAQLISAAYAAEMKSRNAGGELFQTPAAAGEALAAAAATAREAAADADATPERIAAALAALAEAVAAFDATPGNAPAEGDYYLFQLVVPEVVAEVIPDGDMGGGTVSNDDGGVYMSLGENSVTIQPKSEATPLTFVPADTEGQYYLMTEDGKYLGYTGANNWDMSTTSDNKWAWTLTRMANGTYTINSLKVPGRFVGTNADAVFSNSTVYGDKQTSNGNVYWILTKQVKPVTLTATFNIASGTQETPGSSEGFTKVEEGTLVTVTIAAENLEENGYDPDNITVKAAMLAASAFNSPSWPMDTPNGTVNSKRVMKTDYELQLGVNELNDIVLATEYPYFQSIQLANVTLTNKGEEIVATLPTAAVRFIEVVARQTGPKVVLTIPITHEEVEKQQYAGGTETFDIEAVKTALGLESLDNCRAFIVNADGSYVEDLDEQGNPLYDGWRNAQGDAAKWGTDDKGVCVKLSDPSTGMLDYFGCISATHEAGEEIKVKWAITNDDVTNAVILDITYKFIATPDIPFEIVGEQDVPVALTAGKNYATEYLTNTTFDVNDVLAKLGLTSLDNVPTYILNVTTNELVANTTDGWRNAAGDATPWGSGLAGGTCVKMQDPASGKIDYIASYDGTQEAGDTRLAKWAIYDPQTKNAYVINVKITFDIATGINGIGADGRLAAPADIYTVGGQLVKKSATSVEGLGKGVYVVGGKKVLVK